MVQANVGISILSAPTGLQDAHTCSSAVSCCAVEIKQDKQDGGCNACDILQLSPAFWTRITVFQHYVHLEGLLWSSAPHAQSPPSPAAFVKMLSKIFGKFIEPTAPVFVYFC